MKERTSSCPFELTGRRETDDKQKFWCMLYRKKSSREIGKVRGWDIVTMLDVSFDYTNGSLMEERMYIIKISGEKFQV